VANNTRSTLVYLLTRETFLIEDLRTMYPLPNTTASENVLKSLIKRREEVPTDFYGTGAMIYRTWTTGNFEMRTSLTRLAVDGFQHAICNNPSFHEPSDSSKCTLCDQLCERYHLEGRRKSTRSIKDYASQGASVKQ
jgi:hypothetical protein